MMYVGFAILVPKYTKEPYLNFEKSSLCRLGMYFSHPAGNYMFKVNNENTKTSVWNMSKVNNKDTKTTLKL